MTSVIQKIEALHCRLERARVIVAQDKVKPVLGMDDHYTVESSAETGHYLVNSTCSCPDATNRTELTKGLCKHRLATLLYQEIRGESTTEEQARDDVESLYGTQS